MFSLGMIELNSIPKGIEAADAMLKTAQVTLITAAPVCAGKYIAVVSGEVAAVRAAVEAGEETADCRMVDSLVIPNVDRQVAQALAGCCPVEETEALGILETFTLAASIVCADTAVKAADVQLLEVRLGRGLGGKSFVLMTGSVSDCKAAVAAALECEQVQGQISDAVVIPSPHPDLAMTF